jgi:NAD(P)-dependent dehydrogenase (short-subunit alcohol dehydrogenase family)
MTRIEDLANRAVPISGASPGIGAAQAGDMARDGNIVHVDGGMYMP